MMNRDMVIIPRNICRGDRPVAPTRERVGFLLAQTRIIVEA